MTILPVLVLGASVPVNVVAYNQAWNLLHPFKRPAANTPAEYEMEDYQDVRFTTPDGVDIAAWYVPGRLPASVIFLHGYRSNRAHFLAEARLFNERGFHVLLMDCRACGESSGSLNTFGIYEVEDVRGAVSFLAEQPGVDARSIGLMGHSQGAATGILSAAEIPEVSAVLTIAAFTSLEANMNSAARNLLGLPPDPFVKMVVFWGEWITGLNLRQVRPVAAIARIAPRPVLIIHGDEDVWVPVSNAVGLFNAAGEPKELWVIPGAGHSNIARIGGAEFQTRVLQFFENALLK